MITVNKLVKYLPSKKDGYTIKIYTVRGSALILTGTARPGEEYTVPGVKFINKVALK